MIRSKKTRPIKAPFNPATLRLWCAGLGVAALSCAFLNAVATNSSIASPGGGANPAPSAIQSIASVAQYLVPFMCLVATAALVWRRRQPLAPSTPKPRDVDSRPSGGRTLAEFEAVAGEIFRRQGYQLLEPGNASDRIDLVLRKDRATYLVRCRHWRASRVDAEEIRQLSNAMTTRAAAGGFVLTTGRFSREAQAFAAACNVRLIDGPTLQGLSKQIRAPHQGV